MPIDTITLDQIKCFQALIDTGSFTQAAQKLRRAKSAVRYAIGQLEDQLGFKVIDRSHYRPQLTREGKQFLDACNSLMGHHQLFIKKCQQITKQIETNLRISVSGIYGMDDIYPKIKDIIRCFPQTEIALEREILSGEQMLRQKFVDIAIFEGLGAVEKGIDAKKIDQLQLKLVVAASHPYLKLKKKDLTLQSLLDYPQIVQRSTLPSSPVSVGIFDNAITWKVTDTPSKLDIIKNGLGWGRLPARVVDPYIASGNLVHLKDMNTDVWVDIYLGRRSDDIPGKVAGHFWDAFRHWSEDNR